MNACRTMNACLTMNTCLTSNRVHIAKRVTSIREHGATAVEYALMISMITLAIFGAVLFFGTRLRSSFQNTANTIPG